MKLEICNLNRTNLEESQKLNTQPEPRDPNTLLKGSRCRVPASRAAHQRDHPVCLQPGSHSEHQGSLSQPLLIGNEPSSPARVLLTQGVMCFDSFSEERLFYNYQMLQKIQYVFLFTNSQANSCLK